MGGMQNAAFLFDVPEAQYKAANTSPPPKDYQFSTEYRLRMVQPLYYGMFLFAEAAANQADLLPIELNAAGNIKAWSTLDKKTGTLKIIVINKEQDLLGKIRINLPGYKTGVAKRLMAPSFRSQSGITYGGLTFDASEDGKPLGKEELEKVVATDSAFEVAIGPASALLITFNK